MQYIATLGPVDYPTRREVVIDRANRTPDFYDCTDPATGEQFTLHRHKLRPAAEATALVKAPNPS